MNLKEAYNVFTDAWRYFRRYAEQIPMTDEVWSAAVEELSGIIKKHDGIQRITRKLMTAVIDELEHLDREAKGQE